MRIGVCSGLGGVAVSGGPNPAFFSLSPAGWGASHFDNTFPIFAIQCTTRRSARIHRSIKVTDSLFIMQRCR